MRFGEPKYLADILIPLTVERGMALRVNDDPYRLVEPRAISERHFSERAFFFVAPRLFNRLPSSLKEAVSVETFKCGLKLFLFRRAFDIEYMNMNAEYRV